MDSLPRTISTTDLRTTSECRASIRSDSHSKFPPGSTNFFATSPSCTLTLPPLSGYPQQFSQLVFNRIVNYGTQRALEEEKCLNWCTATSSLTPLYTMGDGNCLLHAASLAMWGVQDRECTLRKALYAAVQNGKENSLYDRWKYSHELQHQQLQIVLEDYQWRMEWETVVGQAYSDGHSQQSLEEFHIFVLANVLRRPIIVYAQPKMRSVYGSTLQHVNFHGLYLPLLWNSQSCKKCPLPLAFHGCHFSALVIIEGQQQYTNGRLTIPICEYTGKILPVRYTNPYEDESALIMDYLDLACVDFNGIRVRCAKMEIAEKPQYLKHLLPNFIDACHKVFLQQQQHHDRYEPLPVGSDGKSKCINNCGMFGNPSLAGLCSKCFRKQQEGEQAHQKAHTPAGNMPMPTSSPTASMRSSIKCPHCHSPGYPNYCGMCERCFNIQNQPSTWVHNDLYGDSSKAAQPQSPPPPQQVVGQEATDGQKKCRNPQCEFFGRVENDFYCSGCYKKFVSQSSREALLPQASPAASVPPQDLDVPPKCQVCKDFFGSEEFGWLCHNCFMQRTKSESATGAATGAAAAGGGGRPASAKPNTGPIEQSPRPRPAPRMCKTQGCRNPPTTGGYCDGCFRSQQQGAWTVQHPPPTGSTGHPYEAIPSPLPRQRFTTAPVDTEVTRKMGEMRVSDPGSAGNCFLCFATGITEGRESFVVCSEHARMLAGLVSSVSAPKKQPLHAHDLPDPIPMHHQYDVPAGGHYYNYTPPAERPSSAAAGTYTGVGVGVGGAAAAGFSSPPSVPPIPAYRQRSQSQGGAGAGAGLGVGLGGNGAGGGWAEGRGGGGWEMGGRGGAGVGADAPDPHYHHLQHYHQHHQQHQHQHYQPLALQGQQQQQGTVLVAGASGGGGHRASAAAAAAEPYYQELYQEEKPPQPRPPKRLCRTAGCSFKAVPELNHYCPHCYKEEYNVDTHIKPE